MPERLLTYASDRESGAHIGLMLRPAWFGSSSIRPVATSYSAMRILGKRSMARLAGAPRSVADASVEPSGDHWGCRSAYLSLVSWRKLLPSAFTVYRSVMPP